MNGAMLGRAFRLSGEMRYLDLLTHFLLTAHAAGGWPILAQSLSSVLLGQGQWVRTAGLQRGPQLSPTDHPAHALLDMHVRHLAALQQCQLRPGCLGRYSMSPDPIRNSR